MKNMGESPGGRKTRYPVEKGHGDFNKKIIKIKSQSFKHPLTGQIAEDIPSASEEFKDWLFLSVSTGKKVSISPGLSEIFADGHRHCIQKFCPAKKWR